MAGAEQRIRGRLLGIVGSLWRAVRTKKSHECDLSHLPVGAYRSKIQLGAVASVVSSPTIVEADMKQRFSTYIIRAIVIIIAIAIGGLRLIPGKLGDSNRKRIADVTGEAETLVLAQYNPCPGGKCR